MTGSHSMRSASAASAACLIILTIFAGAASAAPAQLDVHGPLPEEARGPLEYIASNQDLRIFYSLVNSTLAAGVLNSSTAAVTVFAPINEVSRVGLHTG